MPSLRLDSRDVHVWVVDVEAGAARGEVLSAAERSRAERFRFEKDRNRFIVSHAALREILSGYTGRDPASIEFETLAHGKPALVDAPLRFNLSHSAELALVAVAAGCELGVDIERIRPQLEMEAIARRFFSERETEALLEYSEAEREPAFFRCWTRKEAYVKALGGGLTIPLASFEVSLDAGSAELVRGGDGRWALHALEVNDSYAAALAVEGEPGEIRVRRWPPRD